MMHPVPAEYASFFAEYVDQVPENDIVNVLQDQLHDVRQFWQSIPESAADVIHPPYTWKVRQVLDHVVDGERIFSYRLLRIARGDSTPLPGFDENFYAAASEEKPSPLADIVKSFVLLREASLLMIRNFPEAAWDRAGTANGTHVTARALTWIMAGHVRHHDAILRKRLGSLR